MVSHSFLKWVGGKTRIASIIASLAPDRYKRYVEPFCGSAAVFFALRPKKALLNDAIAELIICLEVVRDDPVEVMNLLDKLLNTKEYFYQVRSQNPEEMSTSARAARFIYLNKTSFRGLWRVNRKGKFNTPYGNYKRPYYNRETVLTASEALKETELRCLDFRKILEECEEDDWVFLDPPYIPDRKWGDFTRYTVGRFGSKDHRDLARLMDQLDSRGVKWLLTNSDTPITREIYNGWHHIILPTRRDITLQSGDRKSVDLIVSNYNLRAHPILLAAAEA